MPRVNVLSPALASQIAAGEVVERPSSAAKELIENALDAEATRCDVVCNGGGVSELSVRDDGYGMTEEDATRAVERHATSKLSQISDLSRLTTYGFRGEALPSIASVSRFSLHTRARDAEHGVSIEIEGGKSPKQRRQGLPIGTSIVVKDLFFNVPARRKFLRSTGTESAHVTSVLEGAALSRPDVTFTLERDGRKVRELLRVATRRDRVLQLFEDEALAEVTGERGPVRLEAHLSRPERGRPGTAGLWLLVNGRVIRDRMLAATVAQSYGASLSSGNYPRGVVYLDLPQELVDVNVHPQKAEVRFVDPRALSDAVYSIVSRAVSEAFALPAAARGARYQTGAGRKPPMNALPIEQPLAIRRDRAADAVKPDPWALGIAHKQREPKLSAELAHPNAREKAEPNAKRWAEDLNNAAPTEAHRIEWKRIAPSTMPPPQSEPAPTEPDAADAFDEPSPDTMLTATLDPLLSAALTAREHERGTELTPATKQATQNFGQLRFLAQVKLTFLVCEGADGLYVIDQHAAAERVAFSKLLAQYQSRTLASQALLFPVMVDVLPKEAEVIEAQLDTFRDLGLDVRVRGADRISVHSTPRLVPRASPERLVRDLLTELSRQGSRSFSSAIEQSIALMACHGSLRAGEVLTAQQAQALLGALDDVDMNPNCTHGRPVVAVTRFHDLERQVGRR